MSKERKTSDETRATKLAALLSKNPELSAQLLKALEVDRFLITITSQYKDKATDKHDYHHSYFRRNFLVFDVIPALKHQAADFNARENPTAEIESQEWH